MPLAKDFGACICIAASLLVALGNSWKGGYAAFQADNPDFMNACGHSDSHGGSGAENAENAVAAAAFVETRPWNMSPRRKYGRQ